MKTPSPDTLRIGFIGNRGHWGVAMGDIQGGADTSITCIAPAPAGESVQPIVDAARARGFEPTLCPDWQELLAQDNVDAVVVCGPFDQHAAMTAAALDRGLHVFTEKPVAGTHEDLALLERALAAHPDRVVVPLLAMRYTGCFWLAHKLVAAGAIGEPRLFQAQKSYRFGTREEFFRNRLTGTGIIPWVGVHAIDWVRWCCDAKFVSVSARHTTRYNHGHGDLESAAQMLFELEGDVFATVSLDYLRPPNAASHGDDRLRIVGTEGVVEVREDNCYLINGDAPGERRMDLYPTPDGYFKAFLAAIRGTGEPPVSRDEMVDVARACLLARDSADRKTGIDFPS
ncbi:MAG: Gfo/Idh/MocA family protein [Kiritimatiellia bacterium]|jgi:predicted dehydrogenase